MNASCELSILHLCPGGLGRHRKNVGWRCRLSACWCDRLRSLAVRTGDVVPTDAFLHPRKTLPSSVSGRQSERLQSSERILEVVELERCVCALWKRAKFVRFRDPSEPYRSHDEGAEVFGATIDRVRLERDFLENIRDLVCYRTLCLQKHRLSRTASYVV